MKGISLKLPEELLDRVDAEAGPAGRSGWIRVAVEQRLGDDNKSPDKTSVPSGTGSQPVAKNAGDPGTREPVGSSAPSPATGQPKPRDTADQTSSPSGEDQIRAEMRRIKSKHPALSPSTVREQAKQRLAQFEADGLIQKGVG